jgi:hypothetical protein
MQVVLSANPKKLKASFENCHQEETLNEKNQMQKCASEYLAIELLTAE